MHGARLNEEVLVMHCGTQHDNVTELHSMLPSACLPDLYTEVRTRHDDVTEIRSTLPSACMPDLNTEDFVGYTWRGIE
jgi:hypothetical protein